MRARLPKAARAVRDEEIKRLLREGVTADVIAKRLDCHVAWVDGIRRDLGIATARHKGIRKGTRKESAQLRAMLEDCDRELGKSFVRRLLGEQVDLEGPELSQLHAALRVAMSGAEDFLAAVHARLATLRRRRLDELATSGRDEVRS